MDPDDATRGTSRDLRASQIKSFLTEALAGGEQTVAGLPRAVGLLVEGQSISDAKLFKSAKAALGIRSRRIGFGPGAIWVWILPAPRVPEVTAPVVRSVAVDGAPPSNHIVEILPSPVKSEGEPPDAIPLEWTNGVELLQRRSRPPGIPPHRWSIFIGDFRRFLAGPWAARAAQLGWNTQGLFASRFPNPHEHLGGSGLIWNLAGGQIVQLYRDWAAYLTGDGSARTFHRRPDRTMTFLPWS
jgi:hypothetical protein